MTPLQRHIISTLLAKTLNDIQEIQQAIDDDLPWTARARLLILIAVLQTIHEHITT